MSAIVDHFKKYVDGPHLVTKIILSLITVIGVVVLFAMSIVQTSNSCYLTVSCMAFIWLGTIQWLLFIIVSAVSWIQPKVGGVAYSVWSMVCVLAMVLSGFGGTNTWVVTMVNLIIVICGVGLVSLEVRMISKFSGEESSTFDYDDE